MFCGIVEEIGLVTKIVKKANLVSLVLKAKKILPGTKGGDSISVNGVCLTVTSKTNRGLTFDVMKETLLRTNLGRLQAGWKVNLERAMKVGDRISGHFVSGHIDGMGKIIRIRRQKNYVEFEVSAAKALLKFIVPKGSICVEGVSLTVGKVGKSTFSFYLIPFTLQMTTLGQKRSGEYLNLETDMLAKYIVKWT